VSHATAVAAIGDEFIREMEPRPNGFIDYLIGGKISVTWRGGDFLMCNKCQGTNRYRDATHKGCAHCQRIAQYREDYPS
jgi:hypothetical protein